MGKINILSASVFNRIAAGEVVDRPYSVVKELVENAIDAGATEIEVRIEKGGKSYISVQDNGGGIEYSDLESLFLPHATSKISKASDLENITTLGFRGEAVASVAAISHMRYTTKCAGADCYKIECNGGKIEKPVRAAGDTDGTLVEVEDLFYNTPVRLKFLKSDKAEEGDISTFVNRFILSRPEIAFKYYADNRLVAQSFGGGEEEVIVSVYGSNILYNTYRIRAQKNGVSVRGYISNPNYFKPNRSYQSVFLNGRFIVNETVSAAITNAYRDYAMKRQYPFYVLHIDVPSEVVDVNVHPNKADVRFASNQVVYGAIFSIISAVLDGSAKALDYLVPSTPLYPPEPFVSAAAGKREYAPLQESRSGATSNVSAADVEKAVAAKESETKAAATREADLPFPEIVGGAQSAAQSEEAQEKAKAKTQEFIRRMKEMEDRQNPHYDFEDVREELRQQEAMRLAAMKKKKKGNGKLEKQYGDLFFTENELSVNSNDGKDDVFAENKRLLEEAENQKARQTRLDVDACEYKGNLFNTYLIYECGDNAYFIDQHAAHERLIFNRLKEKMEKRTVMQQPMLLPYKIHITPSEDAFLFECMPLLQEIGFDIQEAGLDRFVVNAVPLDLQDISLDKFFELFLRNLSGLQQIKLEDILRDKLAMMACKAAIKGGMTLTKDEVKQLLDDMEGDTTLKCPHGRPAVVKLSRYEIEKMFKRIV